MTKNSLVDLKTRLYNVTCSCCPSCIKTNTNLKKHLFGREDAGFDSSSSCFVRLSYKIHMNDYLTMTLNPLITQRPKSENCTCTATEKSNVSYTSFEHETQNLCRSFNGFSNWFILNEFLDYEQKTNNMASRVVVDVDLFCCSNRVTEQSLHNILYDFRSQMKQNAVLMTDTTWSLKQILLNDRISILAVKHLNDLEHDVPETVFKIHGRNFNSRYLDKILNMNKKNTLNQN